MAGKIGKLRLLYRYLSDPNISGWMKVLFLLPVIYFISPIDLFPDIIFPFGYIEDIGFLIFGWQMIQRELEKYQLAKSESPRQKKGNDDNVVNLRKDDDYEVKK